VIFNLKTSYLINILGECGASETQISPDKLYRIALIKNRYADTILKSREKTLTQVGHTTHLSYTVLSLREIILLLIFQFVCILFNLIWLWLGCEGRS